MLLIDGNASPNTCLAEIRRVLEASNRSAKGVRETEMAGIAHADPTDAPNYVMSKTLHGSHDLMGLQEVREMNAVTKELKQVLGAATLEDIVPRAKRWVERASSHHLSFGELHNINACVHDSMNG